MVVEGYGSEDLSCKWSLKPRGLCCWIPSHDFLGTKDSASGDAAELLSQITTPEGLMFKVQTSALR